MTEMDDYRAQLAEKTARLQHLLAPFAAPAPAVFASPPVHYRYRAEFRVWHDEAGAHYVMVPKGEKMRSDTVIKLIQFPPACIAINALMPEILRAARASKALAHKLFQAEFLAGKSTGSCVVTLIYHKKLDEAWQAEAASLAEKLNCSIIGRSKGQKIVLGEPFALEILNTNQGEFTLRKYEQSFSQPNADVCEYMINWACAQLEGLGRGDLLELYCGSGTFTLPLSRLCRRVLATEISKSGIQALRENIALNPGSSADIAVARLSAEEFTQAWQGVREFNRLKQDGIALADYDFHAVFVDPPRAGINADTLALLQQFEHIIYISCNPETLADNLQTLCKTHSLKASALFDQFPHTPHIESGVLLSKKEQP